jgi:hypothetical protein
MRRKSTATKAVTATENSKPSDSAATTEPTTQHTPNQGRRLVSRKYAMAELGVCYSTVIRLEKSGVLLPVKLYPSNKAKTFYQRSDVERLVTSGHVAA